MKYPSDYIRDYLDGKLSLEEKRDFFLWINLSRKRKELYFQIKSMYEAKHNQSLSVDTEKGWSRLVDEVEKHENRRNISRTLLKVASYAAIFLAALLISNLPSVFRHTKNQTARYEMGDPLKADKITLPDGTIIYVGKKTTVYYNTDYGIKNRTVYLNGEAYFEVAKQKNCPFLVKSGTQSIEALGTRFNVIAYAADTLMQTTLLEGSVRLTMENIQTAYYLRPNQQLTYIPKSQQVSIANVNGRQATEWVTGYFHFNGEKLEIILNRLNRVYDMNFIVQSEKLKEYTFSGTFYKGQSVKDILDIIGYTLPLSYTIKDNNVYLNLSTK